MSAIGYDVTYEEQRNRLTVAFRIILAIPHLIVSQVWGYLARVLGVHPVVHHRLHRQAQRGSVEPSAELARLLQPCSRVHQPSFRPVPGVRD